MLDAIYLIIGCMSFVAAAFYVVACEQL